MFPSLLWLLASTPTLDVHQYRVYKAAEAAIGSKARDEFSPIDGAMSSDHGAVLHVGKKTGRLYLFLRDIDRICLVEKGREADALQAQIPRSTENRLHVVPSLGRGQVDRLVDHYRALFEAGLGECSATIGNRGLSEYSLIFRGHQPAVIFVRDGEASDAVLLSKAALDGFPALSRVISSNWSAIGAAGSLIGADIGTLLCRDVKGNYSTVTLRSGRLTQPRRLVGWREANAILQSRWKQDRRLSLLPDDMRELKGDGDYQELLRWLLTSNRFRSPEFDFSVQ